MSEHKKPYPLLGRVIGRLVGQEGTTRFLFLLGGACLALALTHITFHMHGHFRIESVPVFFGVYGFVMFVLLILLAKGLRVLVKRPEDYYGPRAIDSEDYPEDQLGKVDYDA